MRKSLKTINDTLNKSDDANTEKKTGKGKRGLSLIVVVGSNLVVI